MKILFVTDAWAPQVNGVVRVLEALIPILESRGHEVRVIEPSQFRTVPLPLYPEIRLAVFPRKRVRQIISEFEPDAICLITEWSLGWAARSVCRELELPFTTWYHSHFQLYVDLRLHGLLLPIFVLIRQFHKAAAQTIVSTESLKKELALSGFRNLAVVPLGINTELFKRSLSPTLPALPKPVFVYFSRLAPEKSPEEFMKLKLPGTKLVIGDGPYRKRLEKVYGKTHLFVGYKKGQALVDWLSLADVFVFPSRTETFGLVVLEALAVGIPVAAHNVMGPRDIIEHGKHGYLSDDLAEAALKALELSRDACRALAVEYTWEHCADAFIKNVVRAR
ncbi:MAG: Alpha-mannosyltransferase [Parcubacteria group bacterium]|nr:Alpha-mannosyltransferase [Parcubacteria group bacterium]